MINIDKSRVLVKDPLSKFHTVSLCLKIHYQIAIDAARFGKRVERERELMVPCLLIFSSDIGAVVSSFCRRHVHTQTSNTTDTNCATADSFSFFLLIRPSAKQSKARLEEEAAFHTQPKRDYQSAAAAARAAEGTIRREMRFRRRNSRAHSGAIGFFFFPRPLQ